MATLLIAAIETAISLSVMLKYFEMANTIRVDFIDQLKA
jgi:NADH:ubiquinone oxidoreductase subunit K